MNYSDLIGQTLDEKYQIERELGRGGMGTVYLANHLGTERPVAIKVIAPQYMERPEFVERFRREARAAGRLRHPNVVDVTDFGFAHTDQGQVAYLVMEYLDGCTLGEILEEEKNLPVSWTLDILEQVCSAVHEAHEQGIIHRDLKPDNIWLEPNQRGGYTVKVLDFGIAKLESSSGADAASVSFPLLVGGAVTSAGGDSTIHDSISPTLIGESGTMAGLSEARTAVINIRPESAENGSENATAIMSTGDGSDEDSTGTKLISENGERAESTRHSNSFESMPTKNLTRVGAVLGTPLYMSPEQCRGHRLDARSDIYSLGVIGYQMLSGSTPFSGDFTKIMESHKLIPPPALNARKVRKKLRRVIMKALDKDPDNRPQTAEAFASELRSRSGGIWELVRQAVMIYTQHLPKFLTITILIYLPFILMSLASAGLGIFYVVQGIAQDAPMRSVAFAVTTTLSTFIAFLSGYLAVGTITWVVNQVLAVPLRPVRVRPALRAAMRNWKRIVGTGLLQTLAILIGLALCILPGMAATVLLSLVAPVVMMEGLRGLAAFKRSKTLVMRSLATSSAAVALLFFVPLVVGGATGAIVALVVDKGVQIYERVNTDERGNGTTTLAGRPPETEGSKPPEELNIQIGTGSKTVDIGKRNPTIAPLARMAQESLQTLLMLPVQILITSLSAIIFALLYLKTRQAGGENLGDLLQQFEETEQPRKKWQERVRQRLIQSGRITSRS